MLKKDLRLKYSTLRTDLSSQEVIHSSLSIANKLLKLPIWEAAYYHIFLPIAEKKEVDTSFILSVLHGKDKNVILPKISGENSLEHILLTDTTKLITNSWGVPEPKEGIEVPIQKIDVVFVPLLAFDLVGNRVGYGKGFYDVFLTQCKPTVIKIGLSHFAAEDSISNPDEYDVSLDYCVTPDKVYSFS